MSGDQLLWFETTTRAVQSRGGGIETPWYECHRTRAPFDGTTKGDHNARARRTPLCVVESAAGGAAVEYPIQERGKGARGSETEAPSETRRN